MGEMNLKIDGIDKIFKCGIDFSNADDRTGILTLNLTDFLLACKPNNWLKMHGYPMRRRSGLK